MKKRLFSLFMAFCCMLMLVPLNVFAETNIKNSDITRYSVLVLDVSGSMSGKPLNAMKKSAQSFCNKVLAAEGTNKVAIVTYDTSVRVSSPFSDDINALTTTIDALKDRSSTNVQGAILSATNLLNEVIENANDPKIVGNIVLLSDGLPNVGVNQKTGRYNSSDYRSYGYANSAYDEAVKAKDRNYFIYTLGFFHNLSGKNREFGERFLRDLQNAGYYEVTNPDDLEFTFGDIADTITAAPRSFKYPRSKYNKDPYKEKQGCDQESTYYYTDSYFYRPATEYNPSLATMSLCLELSTWTSLDASNSNWYDPSIQPDDSRFWKDKLHNIKAMLLGHPEEGEGYEGIGFDHFRANECWEKIQEINSIGVAAARKQITVSGKQYTLIAVAIRGGGYASEWGGNFVLGENGEHEGFGIARNKTLKFIESYVSDLGADESKDVKLWITGYSRAGATANMTAAALDDGHQLPGVNFTKDDIYCYTFEAPQGAVASTISSTSDYSNIHNTLNLNDLVPLVAPRNWGFQRYNGGDNNDCILPHPVTKGDEYNKYYNDMKTQLDQLLPPDRFDFKAADSYNVLRYENPFFMTIPFLTNKPTIVDTPTSTILNTGIDRVAGVYPSTSNDIIDHLAAASGGYIIPNREYFYDYLQYSLSNLMGLLNAEKKSDYVYDEVRIAIAEYLKNITDINTLNYIFEPIVSPAYLFKVPDPLKRYEMVESRMSEKLNSADILLWENVEARVALKMIGTNILLQFAKDVVNKNYNSINEMTDFIYVLVDSGFQGHYPELCLAWCRSLDPNYNKSLTPDYSYTPQTRVIHINCPVDAEVYNGKGTLVAAIRNNVPDTTLGSVVSSVNEKGEKILYLPADTDYTVKLTATDTGTVNYHLSEYNYATGTYTRIQNYYDIAVNKGDVIEGKVPAIPESEQRSANASGSNVQYTLTYNNTPVAAADSLNGDDAENANYTVTLNEKGNSALISGAGIYKKGTFAQLTAIPYGKGTFTGWFDENGTLLSADTTYRFAVTKDVTITAVSTELNGYDVEFKTEGAGKIVNESAKYMESITLTLEAEPAEGSRFAGWTSSNGGVFADASSALTTFVMPSNNTVITAHFVSDSQSSGTTTPTQSEPSAPSHESSGNFKPQANPFADQIQAATTPAAAPAAAASRTSTVASTPDTADNSHATVYLMLLFLSGGLVLGTFFARRKTQRTGK